MIRVLFIGMTSNPGGLETYMINIFSRLEGHGFHFEFINMQNKKLAYSKFIQSKNGVIRHVFIRGSHFEHLTRQHKADVFFSVHHSYDIIHLNTTYLNQIYWLKAAKKYGIKHLIIQSHNCGMDYKSLLFKLLNNILAYYNRLYLRYHSEIHKLAASNNCGNWMFGKKSQFGIIRNGIDTNNYIPSYKKRLCFRKKLDIPLNNKVIITTSRLERQKNFPKIINVFNIVHKHDKNTNLLIVGSGSQDKYVRNMVNHYNLNRCVCFLGRKTRCFIRNILNVADLMLMPSFYEAIPFSLTEAQASGIPSVVSKEGIPREANITNTVKYLSLHKSNELWADKCINVLHNYPYNIKFRRKMNNIVKHSEYGMSYSIMQIKNYYLSLL